MHQELLHVDTILLGVQSHVQMQMLWDQEEYVGAAQTNIRNKLETDTNQRGQLMYLGTNKIDITTKYLG